MTAAHLLAGAPVPVGQRPVGQPPVGASPVGASPVGASPVGALAVGTLAVGALAGGELAGGQLPDFPSPGGAPVPGHGDPRARSRLDLALGGALAGLAGAMAAGIVPAPAADVQGAPGLARSLLWLACAGALSGAAIGGLLAGARQGAARGSLAALWGFWAGGVVAVFAGIASFAIWSAFGWPGRVASFPPGPLAMGWPAWVAAGTLWAAVLGGLLPAAPGAPGGTPGRACAFGALLGFCGTVLGAATGFPALAAIFLGAGMALAEAGAPPSAGGRSGAGWPPGACMSPGARERSQAASPHAPSLRERSVRPRLAGPMERHPPVTDTGPSVPGTRGPVTRPLAPDPVWICDRCSREIPFPRTRCARCA